MKVQLKSHFSSKKATIVSNKAIVAFFTMGNRENIEVDENFWGEHVSYSMN